MKQKNKLTTVYIVKSPIAALVHSLSCFLCFTNASTCGVNCQANVTCEGGRQESISMNALLGG